MAIELNDKNFWTVHERVEESVDSLLQGHEPKLQTRTISNEGLIKIEYTNTAFPINSFFKQAYQSKQVIIPRSPNNNNFIGSNTKESNIVEHRSGVVKLLNDQKLTTELQIYSYYVSNNKIKIICKSLGITSSSTKILKEADIIIASKIYFRQNLILQQLAKDNKIPVYILNNNTVSQITNVLKHLIEHNILK